MLVYLLVDDGPKFSLADKSSTRLFKVRLPHFDWLLGGSYDQKKLGGGYHFY